MIKPLNNREFLHLNKREIIKKTILNTHFIIRLIFFILELRKYLFLNYTLRGTPIFFYLPKRHVNKDARIEPEEI